MGTAIIIITGASGPLPPVDETGSHHVVIAADGGFNRALAAGLSVDLVVGDLDSVDLADLAAAELLGTMVERHPTDKDATDLELALDAAIRRDATSVTVLGGIGDRFDHLVGELGLLASPRWNSIRVHARYGPAAITVLHGPGSLTIDGQPGSLVSLVPTHGTAIGVTTEGLRYPLDHETLPAGTTRGVSNVFIHSHPDVSVQSGCLLIVQPHRFEEFNS